MFPHNFDILSIDVDSCDYDIWKGFTSHKPKIVIIEANSYRDPIFEEFNGKPNLEYEKSGDPLDKYSGRKACGTSFIPLIALGLSKGYIPISFTGNITFVDKDLIHKLKEFPYKISEDPYDYIDLYTNISLWGSGSTNWSTNTGLMFNVAVRNFYKLYKKKEINYDWCVGHIMAKGQELWKY